MIVPVGQWHVIGWLIPVKFTVRASSCNSYT